MNGFWKPWFCKHEWEKWEEGPYSGGWGGKGLYRAYFCHKCLKAKMVTIP